MILNFWGTMVAYQQIVPGSLLDILEDRQVLDPVADANFFWPGFLDNRQWLVATTTVFLFLPLSLAPSVDCLAGISAFATAAMVYMIAIVAKNGFIRFAQEDDTGVPPLACLGGTPAECGNVAAKAFNINSELFDSFATFSFALAGHGIVAVVRGELVNPTGARFAMVALPCMLVVTLLYAVAAVMGYLQFTNWSCANVSEAYSDDVWVFVGQIGVVLCITGGHPVNMFPLKITVDKLLFFHRKESNIRRSIISAACVRLPVAMVGLDRFIVQHGVLEFTEFAEVAGGRAPPDLVPDGCIDETECDWSEGFLPSRPKKCRTQIGTNGRFREWPPILQTNVEPTPHSANTLCQHIL